MPTIPEVNPITIWPLGVITCTGIGNAIPITHIVGPQVAGEDDAGTPGVMPNARNFTSSCQQLEFSAPSANSGDIIVNDGNVAGIDANRTVLIIPKGTTRSIPDGCMLGSGVIDVTRYYVSGADNDKVVILANEAS